MKQKRENEKGGEETKREGADWASLEVAWKKMPLGCFVLEDTVYSRKP
jgi:hypothetical protein